MHTEPTAARTLSAASHGRSHRLALSALALAVTGLLAACGASGGADTAASSTTAAKATTTAAATVSTTEAPVAPAGSDTPAPTTPAPTAPAPTTSPATGTPAPTITSFTTPDTIDCHNGMSQMFTASWSVANATKVTISIDGPGIYKTYAATDSDSFPFGCQNPHTYLLTGYGADGKTVTRTITLQPRNVQASSPDTTEAP